MAKIVHITFEDGVPWGIRQLIRRKIVANVTLKGRTVIARYGVNKTTLKKILMSGG